MTDDVAVAEGVAALWQRVLDVPSAEPDADLFALGGDSLAAVRLVVGIERMFGVVLDLEDVLADPTPAGLARAIAQARE